MVSYEGVRFGRISVVNIATYMHKMDASVWYVVFHKLKLTSDMPSCFMLGIKMHGHGNILKTAFPATIIMSQHHIVNKYKSTYKHTTLST